MKIEIDTHTHTVISGHALSTILENAHSAKEIGLKGFVTTEHGPSMHAAPPDFHLFSLNLLPEELEGVRVYHGIETNIMDFTGKVDVKDGYLKPLDFAIASLHDITIERGTTEQNTQAMIGALGNPYIDVIGHPGNPYFSIDQNVLVKEAKRLNKLVEINNHSFNYRKGSRENCISILRLCKQHGVRICVSSDAHFCTQIGIFDKVIAELKEVDFPEELIVNISKQRFEAYIHERKERISSL